MAVDSTTTPRRFVQSVAFRYLAVALTGFFAIQLVFGLYLLYEQLVDETDELETKTEDNAELLSTVVPEPILSLDFAFVETLMRQTTDQDDIVYTIIVDGEGQALTRYLDRDNKYIAAAIDDGQTDIVAIVDHALDEPGVDEVRKPIVSQDRVLGEVRIGYSRDNVQSELVSYGLSTLVAVAAAGVLLAFITIFLFNRIIRRPLRNLNDTTAAFAAGEFSLRAKVTNPDEIGELAGAFNAMAARLENLVTNLEKNVETRTRDLQAVVEVSSRIVTILDVDRLLQDVSDLVKERFDLYQAQVYLLNDKGDALVLKAGAGYIGELMVAEGRTIALNDLNSVVANAARSYKGLVVNDVTKSADFLPHPLLPDTRSETAVALVARGQLLGVIDVQSDQQNYFTEDLYTILTVLASQIATAISNARLFETADQISRHERALGNISRSIQGATDVEDVLQATVRELGKALRVPYTAIELQLTDGDGRE
ncbi:MAG: HAMP domain-containing protein [Chloroflexi bacterium]|nr:HAMP domain-containing protein [Chloroflexota bacterium]